MDKEIVNRSLLQGAPPTVLGERPARIPTGGTIRAGIKVLTKAAANNPQAKAIYEQGLASNCSFEEIGQKIAEAFPDIKTPLVPKNVAWFTVRPNDFPNPALAAQILATFGEDRGDGVIRLYRFPVIFPADTWQLVMPHELAAWARNDKRYWSEYASDGHTRYCKMYAPVRFDERSQRVVRTFGGRPVQLRPENNGVCDPENCPEFQNRQCNLTGKFIFYIPGIASIDAFVLHTNSFYAMSRAIERFETISFMRGGRLAGFLDQHRTPFYFSKKLRDVSHIDPKTGQSVRSAHWIIELEAPIDVSSLLIQHDDESALHLADQAAHILQGQKEQQDIASLQLRPDEALEVPLEQPAQSEASMQQKAATDATALAPPQQANHCDEEEAIRTLFDLAAAYGVEQDRFGLFADRQWGAGWRRNPNGRQRVLAELERYQNDPEGFCEKVNARLRASDTPSSRPRAPTATPRMRRLSARSGCYPKLTPQGTNLLSDARRVVTGADALTAKARSFSAGLEPELSIVVDVMFPQRCLTDALGSFKQHFPSTPLRLHVEALGRVAELVLNGQCSLGITGTLPFLPPGLAAERLFSEEMVTVVAPGSPLAGRQGPIAFRELSDETQLVLTDRSSLTSGVDYGVQGKNIWRLADLGAKHAFLRAGLGWGHMPRWLISEDLKEGSLVRIELEGPSAGLLPFQATYLSDRLPGPAGRWLLERFQPT